MEEMNEFETKPRGTFWRDWGVYGALALCLAIIGAAVALTSLPKEEARISPLPTEKGVAEAVSEATLPPKAVEEAPETGLPVIRILPTATPEPQPTEAPPAACTVPASSGARSTKRACAVCACINSASSWSSAAAGGGGGT